MNSLNTENSRRNIYFLLLGGILGGLITICLIYLKTSLHIFGNTMNGKINNSTSISGDIIANSTETMLNANENRTEKIILRDIQDILQNEMHVIDSDQSIDIIDFTLSLAIIALLIILAKEIYIILMDNYDKLFTNMGLKMHDNKCTTDYILLDDYKY
jgi:hypothetical protein